MLARLEVRTTPTSTLSRVPASQIPDKVNPKPVVSNYIARSTNLEPWFSEQRVLNMEQIATPWPTRSGFIRIWGAAPSTPNPKTPQTSQN